MGRVASPRRGGFGTGRTSRSNSLPSGSDSAIGSQRVHGCCPVPASDHEASRPLPSPRPSVRRAGRDADDSLATFVSPTCWKPTVRPSVVADSTKTSPSPIVMSTCTSSNPHQKEARLCGSAASNTRYPTLAGIADLPQLVPAMPRRHAQCLLGDRAKTSRNVPSDGRTSSPRNELNHAVSPRCQSASHLERPCPRAARPSIERTPSRRRISPGRSRTDHRPEAHQAREPIWQGALVAVDRCGQLFETGRCSVPPSVRGLNHCWQCAWRSLITGERRGALATGWQPQPGSTPCPRLRPGC